jgi:hypothetical protein
MPQFPYGIKKSFISLPFISIPEERRRLVFKALKKHGVGLVFSHWTWLPALRKQFAKVKVEVRM